MMRTVYFARFTHISGRKLFLLVQGLVYVECAVELFAASWVDEVSSAKVVCRITSPCRLPGAIVSKEVIDLRAPEAHADQ